MSSIAAPSRTETGGPALAERAARTFLAAAVLACLLVTFSPFQTTFASIEKGGSLVNQLGYSALGAVAILGHLLFTDRAVLASLLRPTWLLVIAWLLFSAVLSPWPDQSFRAALFTVVGMIAATAPLTLPPDGRSFRFSLTVAALAVLGLSYFGIAALPHAAVHDAGGLESQHAGLWRGIYSHKNVAGPVMASLFFAGLYLMRSGSRLSGLAISVLAAFFVLKTGSKTSLALLPTVAVLVVSARMFGGRLFPILILSFAVAGMGLLTLGTVLVPALNDLLQAVLPGTTFTGRMDLWRFALETLRPRQWTGFGFEAFWGTPTVFNAEASFELSWDPRFIVNAHNGYLDIAIAIGWLGLVAAVFLLVVLPFRDFLRVRGGGENARLADLFLMILAFVLMNSFLESYLFSRGGPIWMLTWMSVVGLRLLSRHRMAEAGG